MPTPNDLDVNGVSRPLRHALIASGVVTCALLLAGCSSETDGQATAGSASESSAAGSDGSGCTEGSAPLTPIEGVEQDEPRLLIPQPAGWERNTSLDSELIRFAMANRDLTAESFSPNAVVTLEHVPSTDVDPQDVLDQQKSALESQAGATDIDVQSTPNCGSTAETVSYTLPAQGAVPAHPARVLIIAAPFGDSTWTATVTVQAVNPDDPTYVQDAEAILTGFQMLPPSDE